MPKYDRLSHSGTEWIAYLDGEIVGRGVTLKAALADAEGTEGTDEQAQQEEDVQEQQEENVQEQQEEDTSEETTDDQPTRDETSVPEGVRSEDDDGDWRYP